MTVSADPLPTVQIDGVAWTQRVIGNTVYVGGNFTTARPAGSAPGVNTVARANLLAYDITTGNLINSWAPTTNGDVLSIVPSPDNTRLYIGGSFTQVNGQIRNRIAAIDRATGNLIGSFQPKPDATVRAIVATNDTVYIGGLLSAVGGVTRTRVAAVQASDGALLSWAPVAAGGSVHSMIMSPDGTQGDHRRCLHHDERLDQPRLRPGCGRPADRRVPAVPREQPDPQRRRRTPRSPASPPTPTASTSPASSSAPAATSRVSPGSTGRPSPRTWVEDCHGDTYGTFPKGDVIYVASHAHYCGNLPDGFPQTDPWTHALRHRLHQGDPRHAEGRPARLLQLGRQPFARTCSSGSRC